jgi:hypothetical protein
MPAPTTSYVPREAVGVGYRCTGGCFDGLAWRPIRRPSAYVWEGCWRSAIPTVFWDLENVASACISTMYSIPEERCCIRSLFVAFLLDMLGHRGFGSSLCWSGRPALVCWSIGDAKGPSKIHMFRFSQQHGRAQGIDNGYSKSTEKIQCKTRRFKICSTQK